MKDIDIAIKPGLTLKLQFIDAVHPSKVPIKADHWYFYYYLTHKNKNITPNIFSGSYFLSDNRNYLILECYDEKIKDRNAIHYDKDIVRYLLILDFKSHQIANFSRLNGCYEKVQLNEKNVQYHKNHGSIIRKMEVGLDSLNWEPFFLPED